MSLFKALYIKRAKLGWETGFEPGLGGPEPLILILNYSPKNNELLQQLNGRRA